jgi:hypothetical protein
MKRIFAFVVACICLCAPARAAQEGFHPQDIPKQERCRDHDRDSDRPSEWSGEACAPGCDNDCALPKEHPRVGCCPPCKAAEPNKADCGYRPPEREAERNCRAADVDHITVPSSQVAALTIAQFVLYAEQSLRLGDCTRVLGGDSGVRSASDAARGSQLIIGSDSFVQPGHLVIAPSVAVGRHVIFGNLRADQFVDDGTVMATTVPFSPSTMPPLPLASSAAQTGPNVEVGSDQVLTLPPGGYGIFTVRGVLLLNPGQYTVKRVELGDFGRIVAIAGNVGVTVNGSIIAGRHTEISPGFGLSAKHFSILVAGSADNGQPVASFGEHSRLRALVAAPHGDLALADTVRATGAFAAYVVTVGAQSQVRFEDGFPAASPGDHGSQQLLGYYGVTANPAIAPFVRPVPNGEVIHLAIGLPGQNLSGLKTFAAQVSDPKSPQFRKFLTQNQFYATFGATDSDYQALQSWAQSNGFVIRATYPNKLLLSVTGTAAQVERAFFANLVFRKRPDGSNFVAVDREPSLDLNVAILHVSGFTDYILPHALSVNGTGGGGTSYRAADLRNAFLGVGSTCQNLDGSGQVVGLVGFDVFNKSDVDAYDALQLPPITDNAKVVATEGGNPISGANVEATLDVEMVQGMAPNAQILFFQGSSGITGHLDDILMAMATSNPPLTVASSSLAYMASDNEELALSEMAAQGVSFFQGSGDGGDVGDPQQSVNNAHLLTQTLVGGTTLSTNPLTAGLPNPIYPSNYYAGEVGWSGSGGGVLDGSNQICPFICSPAVPIPDYQVGVSMATNGGSTKFRDYPDVAMPATNIEFFSQGNTNPNNVGTSFAAPLWAGFMALVDQRSNQNGAGLIGFLNPTIYDIGLTRGSANDLYSNSFNDTVSGSNGGETAVPGYDLVTGWGSPTCQLVSQLATITPLTLNTPLSLIRFTVVTGDDNAGGGLNGSTQTSDVLLQDGTSFNVTLRNSSESNWDNGSTHEVTFPVPNTVNPPLTQAHGIAGVRINLVQSNPDWSADNWDIADLFVNLLNPGSPQACQLNLVGTNRLQDGSTGLVRLSKNPGGSGVGPSATFLTGAASGCQ